MTMAICSDEYIAFSGESRQLSSSRYAKSSERGTGQTSSTGISEKIVCSVYRIYIHMWTDSAREAPVCRRSSQSLVRTLWSTLCCKKSRSLVAAFPPYLVQNDVSTSVAALVSNNTGLAAGFSRKLSRILYSSVLHISLHGTQPMFHFGYYGAFLDHGKAPNGARTESAHILVPRILVLGQTCEFVWQEKLPRTETAKKVS